MTNTAIAELTMTQLPAAAYPLPVAPHTAARARGATPAMNPGEPALCGDGTVVLASGARCRIRVIEAAGREPAVAGHGRSVVVRPDDGLGLSRGALPAGIATVPGPGPETGDRVCGFSGQPLTTGARVLVRHGRGNIRGIVREPAERFDPATARWGSRAARPVSDDIPRVSGRTLDALPADPYDEVRAPGAVPLMDEHSGEIVGAGLSAGIAAEQTSGVGAP
ncbi:hypothetical protein [Streptomyces camelliae]|uniref:Uncharacterized protein n=1 Tax=Streptomyces camelliae TaxID=3004093 RepID=A0ABY7P5Z2_9ACTN|nr:hypothetical protein [Streptomyces sp. HUAS 2-6]WBO65127.1 hypothetical protein O1G22_20960 [Streptomyces sp. HUAS 2-6]